MIGKAIEAEDFVTKYEKLFAKLSSITFGTYLVHVVILTTAIDLIEIDFVLAEILVIWLVTLFIAKEEY